MAKKSEARSQRAKAVIKRAADAYQVAASSLWDYVDEEKRITLNALRLTKRSVYGAESDGQRALDEAIQIMGGSDD